MFSEICGIKQFFFKESTEFGSSFEIEMRKKEELRVTPSYLAYLIYVSIELEFREMTASSFEEEQNS